ncbi:Flp family type IVb pilin [Vibrio sp. SCSIO 43135]|uniref:Flp family type IVb pilin n=1 Tax=Vibrio sp. SCSIO 43135 TaxID=2819096 RepID=UPI0020751A47|nr:Flp family type IVb pilin [Vibrio sp. SCSIO 43135]USD40108.1 Flp family type IVb pilin [Vibrio sp. SCSIO 43135]
MFSKIKEKALNAYVSFVNDESGVTAIEYAIIGVAITAIVSTVFYGPNGLEGALEGALSKIVDSINGAGNSGGA